MLDFLMTKRGQSYRNLLLDRSTVLDRTDYQEYHTRISKKKQRKDAQPNEFMRTKAWLQKIPDSEFSILVNYGTGRCTSFAIQTVSRLNHTYPRSYSFKYYKLGVHHLARCAQSGIVIDSSSKKGAFILQPGQEMNVISIYSNKWVFLSPSSSRFIKTKTGGNNKPIECESPSPTHWREAIHNCLIDMACKQQLLIYFRSYDQANKPRYYGMIKLNLHGTVEIVLAREAGDKHPPKIVFGGGNQKTNVNCQEFLSGWVDVGFNGYSYREQYRKCEFVIQKIWTAAIDVYDFHGSPGPLSMCRRRAPVLP